MLLGGIIVVLKKGFNETVKGLEYFSLLNLISYQILVFT